MKARSKWVIFGMTVTTTLAAVWAVIKIVYHRSSHRLEYGHREHLDKEPQGLIDSARDEHPVPQNQENTKRAIRRYKRRPHLREIRVMRIKKIPRRQRRDLIRQRLPVR